MGRLSKGKTWFVGVGKRKKRKIGKADDVMLRMS